MTEQEQVQVTTRISAAEAGQLAALAKQEERSVSQVLRRIIRDYLNGRRNG